MINFEAVSNEFCQVFAGIKFEFSLLHYASPTVNDIATSKVWRLQRFSPVAWREITKVGFWSQNFFKDFNNDNDNFFRLKGC